MPNNFPDWTGTWSDIKGFIGKTPWYEDNWSALIDRVEDIADVINTATGSYTTLNDRHLAHAATTTEVVDARDGYASLLLKEQAQDTNIATRVSNTTGLTQNLSGNSFRGVSFANAVDPQDITTLSQVNSLIVGGGSPGDIPITSLDVGTATANQKIKVNGTGDAIIGVDDVTTVTGLDVGTATSDQIIKVNAGGDAIIGQDQYDFGITGFGIGTATTNQIIKVNAIGDAIIGESQSNIGITGFGIGSATTNQLISVNSGGSAIIGKNQSALGITGFGVGSATANQKLEINSGGSAVVGVSKVIYSASRSTLVEALALSSGTGTATYNLTRSEFVQGEYAENCTVNSTGTNLVTVPAGKYLVTCSVTYNFPTTISYAYLSACEAAIAIISGQNSIDGIEDHYQSHDLTNSGTIAVINEYITLTTSRTIKFTSSGVLGFVGYVTITRISPGTTFVWNVRSVNYNVVSI